MAKKFRNRDKRPSKSDNPAGRSKGPNTGNWESIWTGMRGRDKYSRTWNSGYNGPGKGTW